jgi:hypothetical protein
VRSLPEKLRREEVDPRRDQRAAVDDGTDRAEGRHRATNASLDAERVLDHAPKSPMYELMT